jgi:hypothetical protein
MAADSMDFFDFLRVAIVNFHLSVKKISDNQPGQCATGYGYRDFQKRLVVDSDLKRCQGGLAVPNGGGSGALQFLASTGATATATA